MVFDALRGISPKVFFLDLKKEISEDEIFTGAAALTFYLLLSIFPAMIFLLAILPYLPIENLDQLIMGFIREMLPREAADLFSGVVQEVTSHQDKGLVSFGILATIWSASAGMYAIMRQLNKTYDVKEARPFWKGRGVSILMTLVFGLLLIGAFALIVFGDIIQEFIADYVSFQTGILILFKILRWVIITAFMLMAFALIYYWGPNVDQKFRFITPGSVVGVALLILASLGFQIYVENFGNYTATYGSIGAVIILMFWLYIVGVILLFGSEINALLEHYHPSGKFKGQKVRTPT